MTCSNAFSTERGEQMRQRQSIMTENIGFIGLGAMGKRMCKNLLGAAYPLVVFNRSRPAVEELVAMGAMEASSPQEVGRLSNVVILCLPSSQASHDVIIGEQGLADHLAKGSVVIDTSTIDPEVVAKIEKRLGEKGCFFLDAPVSGG